MTSWLARSTLASRSDIEGTDGTTRQRTPAKVEIQPPGAARSRRSGRREARPDSSKRSPRYAHSPGFPVHDVRDPLAEVREAGRSREVRTFCQAGEVVEEAVHEGGEEEAGPVVVELDQLPTAR
jgi:hypothetical protein